MSNPLTPERVQALLEQCDIVALDWPQLHERNLTVPVGVPTLRALLTFHAERSGVCRWTADEDSWDASCGRKWSFLTDGPTENGVKFCHGCGRQVEVTR